MPLSVTSTSTAQLLFSPIAGHSKNGAAGVTGTAASVTNDGRAAIGADAVSDAEKLAGFNRVASRFAAATRSTETLVRVAGRFFSERGSTVFGWNASDVTRPGRFDTNGDAPTGEVTT